MKGTWEGAQEKGVCRSETRRIQCMCDDAPRTHVSHNKIQTQMGKVSNNPNHILI